MPLLNGLEATRQILKALPATKVLMLSVHGEDAYVEEAVNSGAMGYLIKQTSADSVCSAIRESKGKHVFQSVDSSSSSQTEPKKIGGAGRLSLSQEYENFRSLHQLMLHGVVHQFGRCSSSPFFPECASGRC